MTTLRAPRTRIRRADTQWPLASLAKVCQFGGGGTPSKKEPRYWVGNIPWVSPKDMKTNRLSDASEHICEAAVKNSSTAVAPAGSVLVLVRGMGLANGLPVCLLDAPCAFNQDIRAIKAGESLSAEFLAWVLRAHAPMILEHRDMVTHGTLKIDTRVLERWQIPIPPLPEQARIASYIGEQMAAVEKARAAAQARLEAALALPAALAADTVRNGPTLRRLLGDCLVEVRNGVGADWAKYPVLGATRAGLAPAKEGVGKAPDRYKLVDPVSVFYNPMRILLGSIAMVDEGDPSGITSPDYVVVKGRPGVLDARWFYYWFRSAKGAHLIESLSRGAVRERILFNRLAAGEVEVPVYETQCRASERMQKVRPVVDRIRTEIETIDALPAAILRRVFAGAA
jgi:type I restriction enzyme S subunit